MLYVYWLIGVRDLNGNVCREEKEKELRALREGATHRHRKRKDDQRKKKQQNATCSLLQIDKEERREGGWEGREDEQAAGGWSFSLA